MSYIWEKYRTDKDFVVVKDRFSPYLELQSQENERERVNVFYRFGHVFGKLIQHIWDSKQDIDEYENELNIFLHILACIDHSSGITVREIKIYMREREILQGYYGENIRALYQDLSEKEQFVILHYLQRKEESQSREMLFLDVIREIFPVGVCAVVDKNHMVVHIAERDTVEAQNKLRLIKLLFWDFWRTLDVIWGEPYGVVGLSHTMRTDHTTIY